MAANRDEFLARPADPPERSADGRWLAPRDRQAGGTWLGVNATGLFVGVTNRSAGPRDPARRSRGLLVLDALESADAPDLHRRLADARPGRVQRLPPRVRRRHIRRADLERRQRASSGAARAGSPPHHRAEPRRRRRRRPPPPGRVARRARRACSEWRDGSRSSRSTGPSRGRGPVSTPMPSATGPGPPSCCTGRRRWTGAPAAWTESRPCTSAARDGTALLRSVGRW